MDKDRVLAIVTGAVRVTQMALDDAEVRVQTSRQHYSGRIATNLITQALQQDDSSLADALVAHAT